MEIEILCDEDELAYATGGALLSDGLHILPCLHQVKAVLEMTKAYL